MKKLILLTLISFVSLSVVAQSNVSSQLGDFVKVKVSGNIVLTLEQSDAPSIEAALNNSTSDKFEYTTKNGELTVRLKQPMAIGSGVVKGDAVVKLRYKTLEAISAEGGSSVLASNVVESNILLLTVQNKSSISFEVDVRDLTIDALTSGKVSMTGKADYLNIKANTASSVNTITMDVQNANIVTNTNSECYATSKIRFEAKANTNSSIFYKGAPEIVKTSTSTFGYIEAF